MTVSPTAPEDPARSPTEPAAAGLAGPRGVRARTGRAKGEAAAVSVGSSTDVGFGPGPAQQVSERVAAADLRAFSRRRAQSRRLRLLIFPMLALVVPPPFFGHPGPGLHGSGLAMSLGLAAIVAASIPTLLVWPPGPLTDLLFSVIPLVMGAGGIALLAGQLSTSGQIAVSFSVSIAFIRLPVARALGIGGVLTAGMAVMVVARNGGDEDSAATILLCVSVALMALLVRRSWEDQAAAERLTAQLQDAREEHTKAAALAERGRIARDLHDVLAQSLSGLAIQLEAARRVARRGGADEQLTELLDRASGLAKDGLSEARRAVAVLRGDVQASLDLLPGLVERYQKDLRLDVGLEIRGTARELAPLAEEALLRGAQEALTNAARYARGSTVRVELEYSESLTVVTVQDTLPAEGAAPGEVITGSGLGLRGMAERLAQVGGTVQVGPTAAGWLVRMEVPA